MIPDTSIAASLEARDKASYVVGVIQAFSVYGWPASIASAEKEQLMGIYQAALQMLQGGAFNPFSVFAVLAVADKMLTTHSKLEGQSSAIPL